MRKVTVTVALFIAVLSALATPLAAQTRVRLDTDDALSGPHGRARRHGHVRLAALGAEHDHGRPVGRRRAGGMDRQFPGRRLRGEPGNGRHGRGSRSDAQRHRSDRDRRWQLPSDDRGRQFGRLRLPSRSRWSFRVGRAERSP